MSYVSQNFDSKVVGLLEKGGIGFMPSDTIYGLSCRALDEAAVKRLHSLKGRPHNKPFIILISNTKMLDLLSIYQKEGRAASEHWPGALTLVCNAPNSPDWLQLGSGSLAVRLPDYKELTNLIDRVGPIVSTSANLAGQQPLASVATAKEIFGDQLDFYVDVGNLPGRQPSTIARVSNGKLEVLRPGAVKIEP